VIVGKTITMLDVVPGGLDVTVVEDVGAGAVVVVEAGALDVVVSGSVAGGLVAGGRVVPLPAARVVPGPAAPDGSIVVVVSSTVVDVARAVVVGNPVVTGRDVEVVELATKGVTVCEEGQPAMATPTAAPHRRMTATRQVRRSA
jgi:hypothetical protein